MTPRTINEAVDGLRRDIPYAAADRTCAAADDPCAAADDSGPGFGQARIPNQPVQPSDLPYDTPRRLL